MRLLPWLCIPLTLGFISRSPAVEPATLRAFLDAYCISCHGPDKQKGDRRFDQLELPVKKSATLLELQDIIDQLNLGDMPPKKARQPTDAQRAQIIDAFTQTVAQAEGALSGSAQTVLRRLNRREYLNTIGDLFAMDMRGFDPTGKFPRDQTIEHMDNVGETLMTSSYLLDQYLEAADQIVEKALTPEAKPDERSWRFDGNFKQQQELSYSHSRVYQNRYLCVYEVPNTTNHEGGYAAVHGFEQGVPADGLYEIKVKAQAMNRHHPYDPEIFKLDSAEPFRLGIVPGDVRAGPLHHPQPVEPELAEVTVHDGEPEWHTMKVWLNAGQTPRFIFPNGMANSRSAFGQLVRKYQDQWPESERGETGIYEARRIVLQYGKMPHIRIHEVQIRGPIIDQWPPPSQRAVLGDEPFRVERTRAIIASFASRAYRRPATEPEIDRLMTLIEERRRQGHDALSSLKDALKAVLCSPAFLYLTEPGKDAHSPLTSYDLAARLSYFLWSTMPDKELSDSAAAGDLLKPEVLLAQTRRLLASPRSDAFITGFLDGWLNLRALGDMPPDRDAFEVYYSSDLQAAMKRETQLFMRHLIATDAPVTDFIDSGYTFVNKPLARLYGLDVDFPPGTATEFKQVKLSDPRRGGLLGQGSVLTVSANGIETSPVIRGVWLLNNLLGTPPPPPPDNVPPIDPDVRGAKSIREILTKHRESPTCFGCHQKIDPLGFALENFDPIGAWRTRYKLGKKIGPLIDASGELPSGEAFRDVVELKRILGERRALFAKMLTERLLAYACGRRMGPLDRSEITLLSALQEQNGNGMRSLIEAIVSSRIFRSQ